MNFVGAQSDDRARFFQGGAIVYFPHLDQPFYLREEALLESALARQDHFVEEDDLDQEPKMTDFMVMH